MATYYNTLGVAEDASFNEIKTAYKRLVIRYHPDKNPESTTTEKAFIQVRKAYEVVSDPHARLNYDAHLKNIRARLERRNTYKSSTADSVTNADNYTKGFYEPEIVNIQRKKYQHQKIKPLSKFDRFLYRMTSGPRLVALILTCVIPALAFHYYWEGKKEDYNNDKRFAVLLNTFPSGIVPVDYEFNYVSDSTNGTIVNLYGYDQNALVKVVDAETDECVRYFYLQQHDQYNFGHLPFDKYYYLKFALNIDCIDLGIAGLPCNAAFTDSTQFYVTKGLIATAPSAIGFASYDINLVNTPLLDPITQKKFEQ